MLQKGRAPRARHGPRSAPLDAPNDQAADFTSIFLVWAGAGFRITTLSTPLSMRALMASGLTLAGNPFIPLQNGIDKLFEDFTRGFPSLGNLPTMDVAETDKEIEITAELPGLEEKDVQINV